jgi:hypothetical protein
MTESLKILDTLLHTWTDEEVTQAWSMIATEGDRRKKLKAFDNKLRLSKGDKVTFVGKMLGPSTGKVVRIKYKKALVNVSGQTWDVPLSMLTKVDG